MNPFLPECFIQTAKTTRFMFHSIHETVIHLALLRASGERAEEVVVRAG